MTYDDLLPRVHKRMIVPMSLKNVERVVETLHDVILDEVANGEDSKIKLNGLGTFNIKKASARMGRNPKTGESIQIPARMKVLFKPDGRLKQALAVADKVRALYLIIAFAVAGGAHASNRQVEDVDWAKIDNAKHDKKIVGTPENLSDTVRTIVPLDFQGSRYYFRKGTVYLTHVLRIIDGDSFEASVVIWPDFIVTKKFRVAGIDTPEKHPRKKDHNGVARTERARQKERQAAAEVAWYANHLLQGRGYVYVKHAGRDKYGRELVDVFVEEFPERKGLRSFLSYGALLIDLGLAVPYLGGKRTTWGVE